MYIAAKRRETEVFSLSFLDCICCGFGAVLLVFLLTISTKSMVDKGTVDEVRERVRRAESEMNLTKQEMDRLAQLLAAAQLELQDINAKSTKDQLKLSDRKRELALLLQLAADRCAFQSRELLLQVQLPKYDLDFQQLCVICEQQTNPLKHDLLACQNLELNQHLLELPGVYSR